jgi:ABC-type branched-subunit amino acid transport system permease subunit
MMDVSLIKTSRMGALLIVLFLLVGLVMPKWLLFLSTMALSHGIVSLGIVILMRGGVVSFGQGFVFAAGGYATALASNHLGVTDALLMVLIGGFAATLCALPFAPLLSRYRGIFFAMLTLAISMVLYGILVKTQTLGGSDGFNVSRPTLFGQEIATEESNWLMYNLAVVVVGVLATLARIYADSVRGLVSMAIRENELRVEYLGASVTQTIGTNFIIAAFMGGVGGALTLMSLGHIDPNFSYWTTSGEFVFVAILAGHHSMLAVFVGSFAVEIVRSFSNLYFPNTWQLAMGLFLLVVIRFLPRGLGSLWIDRNRNKGGEQ